MKTEESLLYLKDSDSVLMIPPPPGTVHEPAMPSPGPTKNFFKGQQKDTDENMMILSGVNSTELGKRTARLAGVEFVRREIQRFPDDECYLRLETDVQGEHVVIIENAYPDSGIVQCLLLKNALLENGASRVSMVIPYAGYARQDRQFRPGEPISIKVVLQALSTEVSELASIDLHKKESLGFLPSGAGSVDLSAVGVLGEYLKGKGVDIMVGPDKGSRERASRAATVAGCEHDHLEKTRIDGETVKITPKNVPVKGKVVGIIDDMISTGGTIMKAADNLFELGAEKVYACCTHGLFIKESLPRIREHCDEVVCTDTLPSPVSTISVAPVIAEWIEHLTG